MSVTEKAVDCLRILTTGNEANKVALLTSASGLPCLVRLMENSTDQASLLCCDVLCCAVLCCAVLCCAVLCCAVLCCAALRCDIFKASANSYCSSAGCSIPVHSQIVRSSSSCLSLNAFVAAQSNDVKA